MRIDIRLPTLFRATTKRSERERKVYCSRLFSVDVPELSRAEMEIGFRLRNRIGEHVLLARDGRVYRPLMTAGRSKDDVIRQLGIAFSVIPNGLCSLTSGSEMTRPDLSLAISPVQFAIEYHYYRTRLLRRRREPAEWPEGGTSLQMRDEDINLEDSVWENTRNGIDFDKLLDKLASIKTEDLEVAGRMQEMQISRLVMIDGEPWYATRPPCVSFAPGGGRFHVGYFPDWLDHQVGIQFAGFDTPEDLPLGQSAGMLEDGVRYEVLMPELLVFDQADFAARRTAAALSVWCAERLNDVRVQSRRERTDIDHVAENAVAWNELLGEGEDVADEIEHVLAVWMQMGLPISHRDWHYLDQEFVEQAARWVAERERDRPITLALAPIAAGYQAGT